MMLDTTMKGRSCFFAAVFAAIVCMALPSFAADRTISSNYTLTADETVDGILTVESGVTVDLDGHKLTVGGLAGAGTITCNASILSELRMAIPQNAVSANSTVTISGNIRLVKEGLGKFVMEKVGQTYTGGTSLADGTLALASTVSLGWTQLAFGTDSAKPVTLEVGPDATIANIPNPWKVQSANGVDTVFCKQGGDWTLGNLYLGGTSGSTASFQHNGGTLTVESYLSVGDGDIGTGLLDICGGTVKCTRSGTYTLIGNNRAATVVVSNSGSLVVSGSVAVGNQKNTSGTLVVADGGTVSVGGSLIFCNNKNANASTSGRVDLGRGGVIAAVDAYRSRSGSATFNFDGGTFKKSSGTGNIFAASGINVTLSANGGTIDNNGLAITIPCTITGVGGLTLSGAGTTTISANQSYTGTTTVSKGTTLAVSGVTLAGPLSLEAGSKLNLINYSGVSLIAASALALPESGTVALTLNGGAFPAGEYVICSATGGVAASDGDKFVPSTGGKAASWSIVDNKLILTVGTLSSAQDFTWAGGAAANWSDANVWMNADGAATWADNNNAIFNTANATVTLNNDVTAARVVFSADATISTNGTDAAKLTVPIVSVANGVSATISAPTVGALEKTGAGALTLTLTENRTDVTTLTEGTLALVGTASLDWTQLAFGTDSAKPVTLEVGPDATIANIPNPWKVQSANGVDTVFCKQGGDWTLGNLYLGGTSGSTASFQHNGGTLTVESYLSVGDGDIGTGLLDICGGTVKCTRSGTYTLIGNNRAATVVVSNSGSLVVSGSVAVGNQKNTSGTLVVADGGTVSVGGSLIFCNNKNANASTSGRVDLGRGGVIAAVDAYRSRSGSATFNFDGGTFKKSSGTGNIFAASGINVTLSANGGTIDNNGLAITIPCTITGVGGLTLSGAGTTTVSADQSYTGTTTVSKGTTFSVGGGVTLAGPLALEAGSTLNLVSYTHGVTPVVASALALPESGTVALTLNGGAFPVGMYAICSATGGVAASDGAKFAPSTGTLGATWRVENNALILTVGDVSVNYWTGRGGDSKMSTAANWLNGVPAAGATVIIQSTGGAIVNDIENFAPASITFGYGTDTVTISGNAITGVAAITNLSTTASHTINAPVAFADKILVVQGAMSWEQNANPSINFAGGVTGTTFADGTARYLNGVFNLSTGEGWVANTQGSNNRWGLPTGSSLTLPSAMNTHELALGDSSVSGGAFTTGVMRTSARLLCLNYGEYVVTDEFEAVFQGNDTHYCGYEKISNGKFKFEKITLSGGSGDNPIFKFGNQRNAADTGTQHFLIGKGGLCFADGAVQRLRYETGGGKNDATVRLDPWHGDYKIHTKSASNPTDFTVTAKTYFGTTDEDGSACTVTDEGIINSWGEAAQIHIDGNGKFVVNAVCAATCPVTVEGNATLSINAGKKLTTGVTTVNSGATLEVAESGMVALGGDLTLKAGAALGFNYTTRNKPVLDLTDKAVTFEEGETTTVVVKISATADKRPFAGENVLTVGGKFADVQVELAEDAPDWVKSVYVKDGNIALDVKPMGTKVIVR